MRETIVIAVAGNPNCGKSTLINGIAGTRLHTGNWPGVTVEKKSAVLEFEGRKIELVDLPGIYGLSPYTQEEIIARDYLIYGKPDAIINVVDATNLERNLYLTIQLMELGIPIVIALNIYDEAEKKGYVIDIKSMSGMLGISVIPTVATKKRGLENLLKTALDIAGNPELHYPKLLNYGEDIESVAKSLMDQIEKTTLKEKYPLRWLALKLIEADDLVHSKIVPAERGISLDKAVSHLKTAHDTDMESIIADARYAQAAGLTREVVLKKIMPRKRELTEIIDGIVLNRFLGIPIFLGLMYLVFHLTFTVGEPPMGWIEGLFGWLGKVTGNLWPEGSKSLLKSLFTDGVIGGAGGVIVFLPNILLLFLAIAILEDSGYMARVAFIMDRLMHKIGLHGKSFIPMLIGFGCSVPAIMATRTLENRRDRLTTMLVTPLMSCGARLPIYALIIPAFFAKTWQGPMLWTIYVIGILLAIVSAKILRSTVLKGESVPFVMELPPYRIPTIKGIFIHMWERGWLYLKKAGTIILGISILLWAMTTFPGLPDSLSESFETQRQTIRDENKEKEIKEGQLTAIDNAEVEESLRYSMAGRIGRIMEPVISPMGFDWKIGTALIGAFAAKEVFVAQMGIVHSVGKADEESETLREKLKKNYTPLVGFCIMLFCLISAPCMATIAVTARESGSWKWAMLQLAGLTVLAYALTSLVYQIGSLFGIS
jgi:ferrous iron transport protein B